MFFLTKGALRRTKTFILMWHCISPLVAALMETITYIWSRPFLSTSCFSRLVSLHGAGQFGGYWRVPRANHEHLCGHSQGVRHPWRPTPQCLSTNKALRLFIVLFGTSHMSEHQDKGKLPRCRMFHQIKGLLWVSTVWEQHTQKTATHEYVDNELTCLQQQPSRFFTDEKDTHAQLPRAQKQLHFMTLFLEPIL